jgi:hypothetical protein
MYTTTRRSLLLPVVLTVATLSSIFARSAAADPPSGWTAAGKAPRDYDMGVDAAHGLNGKPSGFVRARVARPSGFGTMVQMIAADDYRGKRVRLTAQIKSDGVEDWAGLWLRVDGKQGSLVMDNMQDRPIKGTTPFAPYQVVLDVASDAEALVFGLLLDGPGAVYVNGLKLEVVDKSVPVTRTNMVHDKPKNLDFTE